MNVRSIVMGIVVVLLVYLAANMIINTSVQNINPSNNNPDPAINVGIGNKMIRNMEGGDGGGDMVGIYSANLTGGIKLNYPWPLRDGPGMNVNMNA